MSCRDVVVMKIVANKIKRGECLMIEKIVNSLIDEEQKSKRQKILNDLKTIQKSFDLAVPKEKEEYNINLNKLSEKQVSDENIKQNAESNLAYYKAKSVKDINDSYNKNVSDVNEKIGKENQTYNNQINLVKEDAINKKENAKIDLINKNIIRSSIYQNLLSDLEKNELNKLSTLKAENESKLNELNEKIDELNNAKNNALELFDIAYAVKLQDEINKQKSEIDKYNKEVLKYNNSIEVKEKELKDKYDKNYENYVKGIEERNRKINEFASKYGVGDANYRLQKQKYDYLLDYLNTMNKQTALEILTGDDEFKNEIGETLYQKALDEVNARRG